MKIGIDIDDVCWDYMTPVIDSYNYKIVNSLHVENFSLLKKDKIKEWNINKYIPKNYQKIMWDIMIGENNELYDKMELNGNTIKERKKTFDIIEKIYKNYFTVFITSTSFEACKNKMVRFLNLFPFVNRDNIIICKLKYLCNVDVLIDDNHHNIEDFVRYNENGIGILYSQPWNEPFQFDLYNEYKDRIYVVKNWEQIDNVIEEIKYNKKEY